jgi:hypothetical protein
MVAGLQVGAAVRGCAPGRLPGLMRLARHALQPAGPDAGEGMLISSGVVVLCPRTPKAGTEEGLGHRDGAERRALSPQAYLGQVPPVLPVHKKAGAPKDPGLVSAA